MSEDRVPIEGSLPRGAVGYVSDAPPAQTASATVVVRHRGGAEPQSRLDAILRGEAPPMSREEAERSLEADPEDVGKVVEFARSYGLAVTEASGPRRSVGIAGTAAQMEAAFGVKLRLWRGGDQAYLCYEAPLTVPAPLAGIVEAVLGLDQRPVAKAREPE